MEGLNKKMIDSKKNLNIWVEINNQNPSYLKTIDGIILLSHNSIRTENIINIINQIKNNNFNEILYISLTRSYHFLKTALELTPLENKKINIIDCVSGFAFPISEEKDCMYRKPPNNLKEMKEIINYGIKKTNSNIVIIDSLSQFINFSKPAEEDIFDLYSFLRTTRNENMDIENNTFILLYDDKLKSMKKLPKEYFDEIIKIEENMFKEPQRFTSRKQKIEYFDF